MDPADPPRDRARAVLTAPNLISLVRIVLIPVFAALIVDPDTTAIGLAVFALVAASDWVDGYLARRLGQVSELGKILDPTADRLALGAGLIALAVRGAFPWWAAWAILARDALLLAVGALVLLRRRIRIEVRWIGKFATLNLMVAVTSISWGTLGYPPHEVATVLGWATYAIGIATAYAAAALYVGDLRRALEAVQPTSGAGSC
jgi:cardiolipin synthase